MQPQRLRQLPQSRPEHRPQLLQQQLQPRAAELLQLVEQEWLAGLL
ncbi:hypothetical protein [Pseudomonas sp. PGPR40]|nr:hypothetical protein [Pseudomonas sp. PGPR40]